MKKVHPDELVTLSTSLKSDGADNPTDGLTSVKLGLYYEGQFHKTLDVVQTGTSSWLARFYFPKEAELGRYEAKWEFDFDGDIISQREIINLGVKRDVRISSLVESAANFDIQQAIKMQGGVISVLPVIYPSIESPKWDQDYSQYMKASLFAFKRCGSCMHFIPNAGDREAPGSCQLILENPLEIVSTGWCRLWRDSYELEGFRVIGEAKEEPVEDDQPQEVVEIGSNLESVINKDDQDNIKEDQDE